MDEVLVKFRIIQGEVIQYSYMHQMYLKAEIDTSNFTYSAAQIYPNQNICVVCVSPISVCIYVYARIQYASLVCMS